MDKKFKFAGIEIDNLTIQEAIDEIEALIKKGKSSYIVTPNAAQLVLLQKDKEFKKVYESAHLALPDGMSVIWASKILGAPLQARITGTELLFSLLGTSCKKNYKIFLLGGGKQIIEEVNKNLQLKFPNLQIVGNQHGYFSDDREIIEKINKTQADILFIGLGFPKQEKWIYHNLDQLSIKVAVCIGGVFDVVAGKTKRAPEWMQKAGIEWFFRLIQEPQRLWKRYLVGNIIFIWLVFKEFIDRNLR